MSDQVQALPQGGWPAHGGNLGRLIRERDWSQDPHGSPAFWDPALRTAVDLILPAGVQIVMFWGDEHLAFYNDAYAPTIGDKHPGALGQPAHQYWGELWDDLGPLLERVRSTGETFSARDRPFQMDRAGYLEEVYFDVSYSAIRKADGHIGGVLCIVNETTSHLRALDQLDLAQAAGGAGVFEWYPDTGEIVVSDGYRRIYGYAPGTSVTIDQLIDQMHPDDQALAAARRGEPLPYIEFRITRADNGEERWLSRRAELVRPNGGRLRLIGVTADVTERKRVEEELIRLNETLEARVAEQTRERDRIWRNSRDLMVVVGPDGVFRAANPAWETMLGWPPEMIVGHHFSEFVIEDDNGDTQGALEHAVANGVLTGFENRYRTRDGKVRWISWHSATEGDQIYVYGRDITGEKEKAELLAHTEDQLRQAQKMEAVGQLTGGIAHDFNNLLQGIIGSLDLMRTRIADGRTQGLDRFITGAQASAERASALTHRLLAFSRRQPLDPRPLKANPLVASMEELLRRTLGETIELELVLAGGLWMTLCDANQLESAILNLALNARDAMLTENGMGGGKLTIETANTYLDNAYVARDRDVRPGQYVCISVSDTGQGMAQDVMARAFDPFFTTKPIGAGTGLGLSMIYGFARQSEGSVKLYSEPSQGTTAKLYLPRHRADATASETPQDAAPEAVENETVLVVEDEPVVRSLIVEVLTDLGYRAIEASDGLEGLRLLKGEGAIDLLITDMGLPGLNGRQMVEGAREFRPGLRVLFMTGYAENAALASGFLEPGMEMITKPFAMEILARRIGEMLQNP